MPFSEVHQSTNFNRLSRAYLCDETNLTASLAKTANLSASATAEIQNAAANLTRALLEDAKRPSAVDAFLNEYTLSSEEGILLMRLAESLVRTPDSATANYLLRDKLAAGTWRPHLSARHSLVKLGTAGLCAAKAWCQISGGVEADNLLARLGDTVMLRAVRSAIALLGRHFVLGTSIRRATGRARALSDYGATYSYDMLGEAAMTDTDAERYFAAYKRALQHLAKTSDNSQGLHQSPALSVKLSALHPRYEYAQRETCVPELVARVLELCEIAKSANIGLTIDAEEADRLEVSLLVIEAVLATDSIRGWAGFGLAVQAYQRRATRVIERLGETARRHQQHITVRLVKGAYWDSEIKRAQELGLDSYPVFTRKEHTDISYLACARKLLDQCAWIYPQFATHNAHTAAAIVHMAGDRRDLEFQRLHGMSDGLHRRLAQQHGFATRTYAPVGRHKDLLPYLVRRLLENGANSSFVNQLSETDAAIDSLIQDPIAAATSHGFSPHPAIPNPCSRNGEIRQTAAGDDMTQSSTASALERRPAPVFEETIASDAEHVRSPIDRGRVIGAIKPSTEKDVAAAIKACTQSTWSTASAKDRSDTLRKAADLLERDRIELMSLCVHEAGKSWPDAEAELREAVDFLRYYADQAERPAIVSRPPLGITACISPWNFPLAIFLGQVSAALSVGNTVIAKPAEQTPLIATEAVKRLYEAGLPANALHLILGGGSVGAYLVAQSEIRAVCFTGSTATAKRIAKSLAETKRGSIPLIAETGGINAMLIDSTALLEQAVRDVMASAFQSAGQRCSACRLVCVQEDVADAFIAMLSGAMQRLHTGDPSQLCSDVGPIIDETSHARIADHITNFRQRFSVIGEAPPPSLGTGSFISPIAFEINTISDLTEEVFGPVLHLVRFRKDAFEQTVEAINRLRFGLTMGLHTRIDARAAKTARIAKVGNLYVNRNQIGAIVGEQPFGGEGLSGTGPKAGGPGYLKRLSKPPKAAEVSSLPKPISLPAPTGETNTLSYVPRGLLLCLGGDQTTDLDAQLARVHATGNTPVLLRDKSLAEGLESSTLNGVVADGKMRSLAAALLAERSGAIIPLLSAGDEPERFWLERVVTTDTTAAGGNASLLAQI